jgi:hypothetical protein
VKRIKHNNLLPWFTQDHGTLPASYLASCEEFFKWLEDSKRTGFKAPSSKLQAAGSRRDPDFLKKDKKRFDSYKIPDIK